MNSDLATVKWGVERKKVDQESPVSGRTCTTDTSKSSGCEPSQISGCASFAMVRACMFWAVFWGESRVGSRKFSLGFARMKPSWDLGSTLFQHFLISKCGYLDIMWPDVWYGVWTIVLLSLSYQASRSCALERRCCVAADGLRNERGRSNVHWKRGFSHHEGTHPLQNHGSVEQNTRMTDMFSFDIKVPQKNQAFLFYESQPGG